jgi:putative ABC transport system permease protein
VANLLLARAADRRHEMVMRTAIGAGRTRRLRQALTESSLLALVGGAAGSGAAVLALRLLTAIQADVIPRYAEVGIDGTVLAFSLGVTLLAALVFGLAPAMRLSRPDSASLKRGGSVRHALAVVQIAAATVLLIGAGLLIHSFLKLSRTDLGFDPENVLTFRLTLPAGRYPPAERVRFEEVLLAGILRLDGVRAATATTGYPSRPSRDLVGVAPPGASEEQIVEVGFVSPSYVPTLGLRLSEGRNFEGADRSRRVAVVNRTMASRFFPGGVALGRAITLEGPIGRMVWEVIGVVDDVKAMPHEIAARAEMYIDRRHEPAHAPPGAATASMVHFAVRTDHDPLSAVPAVRRLVSARDSQLLVDGITTLEQDLSSDVARPRLYAVLLGLFAAIAAILAVTGVYSVVSYSVALRTREIGVRIALGATGRAVTSLVLRQGVLVATSGIVVGLAAASALTRFLNTLLFGLTPRDPFTFTIVPAMFAVVAMLAAYLPARRTTLVDPVVALRHDA